MSNFNEQIDLRLPCYCILQAVVLPVQANTKLCNEINTQISKLDKHADDFYSLANYEFNDEKLLKKLKDNSRYV